MSEIWELGISDVARELRARSLSALEVVNSLLDRLDMSEDFARAWAFIDAEGARSQARAADKIAAAGSPLGVLHGIPIGIKDVIDVAGMPTGGGSASLRGRPNALADAGVVRALRSCGAVMLGKTVTHEFAFGQGTPPSRNPWDPSRYAGGSSVGSGVAVAVGSALGTIGTDTGGSVRNPASVNGLVGLKPSAGLIDGSGVLNVSRTLDQVGAIARNVEDCSLLFQGMVAQCHAKDVREGAHRNLSGKESRSPRVAVDRSSWAEWGVTVGVQEAVDDAISTLGDLGIEIVEMSFPNMSMALPASLAIALSEATEYHRHRLRHHAPDYLAETRVMLETGALVSAADVTFAHEVRASLRSSLHRAMEESGLTAVVSPTLPAIAPLVDEMTHELTASTGDQSLSSAVRILSPANMTGMPALSVPCGFASGQPVGLHVMGPLFSDAMLLELARSYEDATLWHSYVPVRTLPAQSENL
ncbi:MAG: amidase [Microbacteriaceae bacterium]|nr:MAG: amidase [Microbacteriaceae bacterium]